MATRRSMRKDGQPPFNRTDLFCEMMLWQSEQLGDGDKKEYERNGCPWNGVGKDQTARKGKSLRRTSFRSGRRSMPSMFRTGWTLSEKRPDESAAGSAGHPDS